RVKTPPPAIELRPLYEKVNSSITQIYSSKTFTEDVKYLQANGIPVVAIANRLGIDRQRIYDWMNGMPTKNPTYVMLIREWAHELRNAIKDRDSGGCSVSAFVR
ncbi:MAG: hypothetical protein PHQ43_09185, partial [Dehalococcoidales bacterium]|nr:hypothetical protein [Dehalococcoidales bacterium]